MMTTKVATPEQHRVACTFLRDTLAGQLRPELVPQMGPWQEVGRILLEALANDGLPTARRIFTTLCKHDPRLIPLVSADPPAASPVATAAVASPAPVQQTATATQAPAAAPVTLPTLACTPLPAQAHLPEHLGTAASRWLD